MFSNPSDVSGRLVSALKAKAPIVAIPVDGHAPVCVKRSRLVSWSKSVSISTVEVVITPDQYYCEEMPVRGHYTYGGGTVSWVWEGPKDLKLEKIPGSRYLVIKGQDGCVRTTAKFLAMDRRIAVKELAKWSEKERLRIQKKALLGALSPEQKKAIKRAKFEDDGEGMIAVMVAGKETTDPKTRHMGVSVSIPEMESLNFAVVRFGTEDNVSYSVTELSSGRAAGFGKTAEEAILNARKNARSVPAERLAEVINELAAA